MKKEIPKIAVIFLITVGIVVWALNFIFLGQAPKSKATGETMSLSFNPSTQTVAANADFTVSILAKPSLNTILRGYKTKVNFDKSKLSFKSIQYKVGVVSAGLGNTTADVTAVNGNGFVDVIGEDTTATGYVSTAANGAELVSLTFTALSTSGTTVTTSDSSFYSINADNTLFDSWTVAAQNLDVNGVEPTLTPIPTVTPPGGPTLTPAPTVTPGGPTLTPTPTTPPGQPTNTPTPTGTGTTGNVKLNLKLKFQGIINKPTTDALSKLNVKIKLLNETTGQETAYQTAEFTADDQAVWSGNTSFNVDVNSKYTLYVKGPYHIQKKICNALPTETAGGTYRCTKGNITLENGDNNLNLSGIVLLAGDLPEQDGTVTAYDTSFIYNNLGKNNDKCDVNRDGICDTQDFSLVIAALTVKNDEL